MPRGRSGTLSSRETARRFHFLREIASGGFGTVYLTKVMHADGFSRLVAVKLLKSQWTDTDEVARRMRDEARLLGLLRHRHIVNVMDLTAIDGRAAVVMEYLEAVDLRHIVKRMAAEGGRIPLRACLEMSAAVASALDAAYNRPPIPGDKPLRVIHRDIKPSNIMVDDTGMVKVLDFGVARSEIENRESHTQELQFGSVDYMAPERLFFEPETPSSDVYSLGATLYELLARQKLGKARGRPETHAQTIAARLDALGPVLADGGPAGAEVRALLEQSLAYEHERRPTAAEFYQRARALARAVSGEELSGWAERVLPRWIKAHQEETTQPSALDDAILSEDSSAFSGELPSGALAPSDASIGDELRRGALAELEETGAIAPAPPTGAPRASLRSQPGLDDLVPEDGPTFLADAAALGLSGRGSATTGDEPSAVHEPLAPARTTPVPVPKPPPPPAAARARYTRVVAEVVSVEPTASANRTDMHRPLPPSSPRPLVGGVRRPSSPTLIPDEAPAEDGDAATVMMSLDPATGEIRSVASGAGTEGDEARTEPVGPVRSPPRTAPEWPSAEVRTEPIRPEKEDSRTDHRLDPSPEEERTEHHDSAVVKTEQLRRPEEVARTEQIRRPPGQPDNVKTEQLRRPEEVPPTGQRAGPVALGPTVGAPEGAGDAASASAASVSVAAPAPKRRTGLIVGLLAAAVVLLLCSGVGGGLVLFNLDALRAKVAAFKGAAPTVSADDGVASTAGPDAAPDPAPDEAHAAATAGPALIFASAADDTKKIKARCGAANGEGADRAVVPVEAADTCTVTAYLQDRSRRTAAVQKPTSGTYRCFAADSDTCERQ